MKCPWCNEEMISGFVQGTKYVYFAERKHKFIGMPDLSKDKEVLLSENSFKYGPTCEAYRCKACKRIVIDYTNIPQRIY